MASSFPPDCVPIIQSYLDIEDFVKSRSIGSEWIQKHSKYVKEVDYQSRLPIPEYLVNVKVSGAMTSDVLKKALHLKRLYLNRNMSDDGIKDLVNLTHLTCSNDTSDDGVKNLKKLEYLGMVEHISGDCLASLPYLDNLWIVSNSLFKNRDLPKLKLRRIAFSGPVIQELVDIPTLKKITYTGKDVLKASFLNKMPQLTDIYCDEIDNIDQLRLPNLKRLTTDQENLFGVGKLTNLKEMYHTGYETNISDQDLLPLVNLQVLYLGRKTINVTNLGISQMKNLDTFSMGGCKVNGEGLRQLPKLEYLFLDSVQLENDDIEDLPIKYIDLGENTKINRDCKIMKKIQYDPCKNPHFNF